MNAEKSPGSRIAKHAVLGDMPVQKELTIYFEGKPLKALEGEPAAMGSPGVRAGARTHSFRLLDEAFAEVARARAIFEQHTAA